MAEVIERGLHNVKDHGKALEAQLNLATKLIDTLVQIVGEKSLAVLEGRPSALPQATTLTQWERILITYWQVMLG